MVDLRHMSHALQWESPRHTSAAGRFVWPRRKPPAREQLALIVAIKMNLEVLAGSLTALEQFVLLPNDVRASAFCATASNAP